MNRKRNPGLDYMRGIACLMILLYHYSTRYEILFGHAKPWPIPFAHGNMGVAVFFVLSGYLAMKTFRAEETIGGYWIKKGIRLFPAYWVCLTLTFLVTTLWLPSRAVSLRDALLNLPMLHFFIGVPSVDGAYWALAYELVFYAFVWLCLVVLRKKDQFDLISGAYLAFLFLMFFAGKAGLLPKGTTFMDLLERGLALDYGQTFLAGVLTAYLFDPGHKRRLPDFLLILLCVLYHGLYHGVGYTVVFALALLLVALFAFLEQKQIQMPDVLLRVLQPLAFIASISYPLYLCHQNIGMAIIKGVESAGGYSEWFILVPLTVCGVLSWAIHRFVELPVQKFARRKLPKGGPRSPAAGQ